MVQENGIYKCKVCGTVVSVLEAGAPPLMCCGKEMTQLEEHGVEQEGKEKHVPVVEINGSNVKVKVGSVPHPMEEKHYIELIQIMSGDSVIAGTRLNPGEKPEAEFCLEQEAKGITARELCNIHGLWKSS